MLYVPLNWREALRPSLRRKTDVANAERAPSDRNQWIGGWLRVRLKGRRGCASAICAVGEPETVTVYARAFHVENRR